MLFSIIIPVYNVELYIEKCLLSCLNQESFSIDDYEIIVVNDGTKDTSILIAQELVMHYPNHNLKFIERENGGLSAARNTGLLHAEGKYVWFVDSDDWIVGDALSSLKQKIAINNQLEIITFTHVTAYSDGKVSKVIMRPDYAGSGFDYLAKNNFLSAGTCIYLTSFLNQNNFVFKEGIVWEDSEFNLRAYALVENHYFFAKPLYYYSRREGSITSNGINYKMVNSWFIKVDSVYDFFQKLKLTRCQLSIINNHLASTIITALAGIPDLPLSDRKEFFDNLQNRKKFYWQFFNKSSSTKIKISGLLMLFSLPLSSKLFRYIIKEAIKRGEGRNYDT